MSDLNPARVYFEGSAPILRVENMEASLQFYVNLLGFQNATKPACTFARVDRAGAERGSGLVSKTPKGSTRNVKLAGFRSVFRLQIIPGRSRCS